MASCRWVSTTSRSRWSQRPPTRVGRGITQPAISQELRYPFVHAQVDASLIALRNWRAGARRALGVLAVEKWSRVVALCIVPTIGLRCVGLRGKAREDRNDTRTNGGYTSRPATGRLKQVR